MIKSMTAFACESQQDDCGELTWEIRSVNHRFLEPHLRFPEELRNLEVAVRARLTARLQRGKIDCTLRYVPAIANVGTIQLNLPLIENLLTVHRELNKLLEQNNQLTPFEIMRWPGMMQTAQPDCDHLATTALNVLERTLNTLIQVREREGARLATFINERCACLIAGIQRIRMRVPEVLEEMRQRLRERLIELQVELDPIRLEQEFAILITRMDVAEELDRLQAHSEEVQVILKRSESVGRRLDFLMQELNREANTLGSKSSDLIMAREVIELKVLIEQMREQIQNLE